MTELITERDKIFVAGSSGMVGSAIKRNLLKKSFKEENILSPSRNELNLFNGEAVKRWFFRNKPNIVILAAARVGGILANSLHPVNFLNENLKIQINVIENAYITGVRRLLFLGSSCIYPKYVTQPIVEESLLTGELETTNESYAVAKIAGLKLCEALRKQYGFDAISLMPTNLYGPNDNYHPEESHVMAALIRKFVKAKNEDLPFVTCWGSGKVYREFLHVDDLAEAVYFCLSKWDPSAIKSPKDNLGKSLNHLNVGTGKDILIKDLAIKVADILSYKGKILWDKSKPDGTPRKVLDVSRINEIGWSAKIDLDLGIKQTIKKFEKNITLYS
ncbi:MAG: GDP-L-fucose synthase [Pelagibacteraceae bacterium TMED124]|nr:MAG: GDP-L-fucose synthase [Pelagibacteraceae bacterium TMED124]|tara:strand:+ start:2470 stop:3465 length:996 start_codon:yes stop_codon:yes gene_type:complete